MQKIRFTLDSATVQNPNVHWTDWCSRIWLLWLCIYVSSGSWAKLIYFQICKLRELLWFNIQSRKSIYHIVQSLVPVILSRRQCCSVRQWNPGCCPWPSDLALRSKLYFLHLPVWHGSSVARLPLQSDSDNLHSLLSNLMHYLGWKNTEANLVCLSHLQSCGHNVRTKVWHDCGICCLLCHVFYVLWLYGKYHVNALLQSYSRGRPLWHISFKFHTFPVFHDPVSQWDLSINEAPGLDML